MKNTQAQVKSLGGLYEKLPQATDGATELTNWTVDKYTGGWDDRIGYERYYPVPTGTFQPFSTLGRIDSLAMFNRHQGSQQTLLFESGGTLYHLVESLMFLHTVETGRTRPTLNEAPTQYVPYGRWMVILNGYDRPVKYAAWPFYRNAIAPYVPFKYDLGWHTIPDAPNPWGVETSSSAATSIGQNVCVFFDPEDDAGLGIPTDAKENKYKWRMSYINNAGSESPLSGESEEIAWTTIASKRKYAAYIEIPTGPDGTVGRRLYRTKNYGAEGGGTESEFFFVKDINNNTDESVWDSVPDGALGSTAPGLTSSVTMPSTRSRFGAVYKDCLFIDGGADNDTMLHYSKPVKPDEFEALSFVELGNRNVGGITGLYPYFNFLLVFRENGIDAITGDYPNFSVVPISTDVGTRAINTVTNIPGVGVVFLASDGVYSISSNMAYSDSPGIKRVSTHMLKTMERINPDCIAKACAVYSPKWQEWHCYFPADGNPLPSLGIVYHVEKNAFSVRQGFPVGCLARDYLGNIFFGHNQGTDAGAGSQAGIFVVSRRRCLGQSIVDEAIVDNAPPTSIYRSPWMDMGDETIKKNVHYVYLYVLTQGNNSIAMEYFKDFNYAGTTSPSMTMQRADHVDQSVYDTATVVTGSDAPWEEPLATPIRYPIAQGSCSHFQFKISTTNDMVIVGYAVEFTASGTRMITGKRT
tara:strand:- start:3426 stop:5510 length:2085 start_codon:yes stop_codon:yes gene_type:complete